MGALREQIKLEDNQSNKNLFSVFHFPKFGYKIAPLFIQLFEWHTMRFHCSLWHFDKCCVTIALRSDYTKHPHSRNIAQAQWESKWIMHETWERKQMLTNLKMGQTHDNLVSDKWSNFSTILTNCVPFDLCPYWFAEHKRSFSRQMDNFPCRGEFSFYMPDMMRTNKLGKPAVYLRWNIDGQAHENANVYIHHFF